jgi:dolichol-phosphate mannosyltransferase
MSLSQALSTDAPLLASVVIAIHNEEGACVQVAEEVEQAFTRGLGAGNFEIIFVDDQSTDKTVETLKLALGRLPHVKILLHEHNVGKSGGVRTGVLASRGTVIGMMDGDGQNPARDVLKVVQQLIKAAPEVGLVAGERKARQDKISKKWASRWANSIRKSLLKDGSNDTGCGIKAIRREAFLRLPYFDNMHRYIPALVNREGFKIEFASVEDRPRTTGQSKYTNIGRLWVAFSDLPGVMWLNRRYRNPGSVMIVSNTEV